jgi:hypothetical protein
VVKKDIGRETVPTEVVLMVALAEQVVTTAAKTVTSHANVPILLAAADVVLVVAVELVTAVVKKGTLRENVRIRNRTAAEEEEAVVVATIVGRKATCQETVPIRRRKALALKRIGPKFNVATAVNVS